MSRSKETLNMLAIATALSPVLTSHAVPNIGHIKLMSIDLPVVSRIHKISHHLHRAVVFIICAQKLTYLFSFSETNTDLGIV